MRQNDAEEYCLAMQILIMFIVRMQWRENQELRFNY